MPETSDRALRAAGTSVVVTPSSALPLGGYAAREGSPAVGRLDDLEANLLWLNDGQGGDVLWVSIDVLAIETTVRDRIATQVGQTLGIDPSAVIVAASHTHSAPAGWHGEIHPVLPTELDDDACDDLVEAIGGAAHLLRASLAPVSLEWGESDVSGVGSNRHEPDGPCDRSVGVVTVRSQDGSRPVRAVLFDHACHPTVLGADNLRWSADWVGAARASIRAEVEASWQDHDDDGRSLPVVFLQGSAGDISPRFHRRGRDPEEVRRLGDIVGRQVLHVVGAARPFGPSPRISVRRTVLELPLRPLGTRPTARAIEEAPSLQHMSGDGHRRLEQSRHEGQAAIAALLARALPETRRLPISLVSVGDRRWLHLPVELCASFGLRIVERDPDLRVVGYADAYCGYVADAPSHAAGHYEAMSSFFDAETSERFVEFCLSYVSSS